MRIQTITLALALALPVIAQEPAVSPTQELRTSVGEWVETMRKIQQEENDWSRDQEVLKNYKEGLEKEIGDLKEQIASAKIRKDGSDKESLDKIAERDLFVKAKEDMTAITRSLEEGMISKIPFFPEPLMKDPKVAQGIEDLKRDFQLPVEKRGENVSKRLLNVVNLLGEAEKFQTLVHVRPELHRDSQGREFNVQAIYFGLAMAYAVNEDGSFALMGRPGPDGWKFEERKDLAPDIVKLLAATTGEADATFINLPFNKP